MKFERSIKFFVVISGCSLIAWALHTHQVSGHQVTPHQRTAFSTQPEQLVKQFLRNYYEDDLSDDPDIRYLVEFIDLDGDKREEALVYVIGRYICGTSGCSTFVLARTDSGYRKVTEISITNLPVRVLQTLSHGWRDLEVRVIPGGLRKGYQAVLSFDGRTYPENPSIPPARPTRGNVAGHILFRSAQEKKLEDK